MTYTEVQKIRAYLINDPNNTDGLSDDLINMYRTDAQSLISTSDDLAINYYTAYIISLSWQSLGFVTRQEGVSFERPDPSKFLKLYKDRISVINSGSNTFTPLFTKVSLNKGLKFNSDGEFEERVS